MNMEDKIYDVVVPTEEVMELKAGKMQSVQKKVFPGYILVRMELDDDSWYVVRNTPGVTGFVGSGAKPTPLDPTEVSKILAPKTEDRPKPKLEYEVGEVVSVVGGAFAGYSGPVNAIDVDKQRVTVLLDLFGRETPVELDVRSSHEALGGRETMAKKVLTKLKLQLPGRTGVGRAARRPGARSARREHHAVRPGIQRGDAQPDRHGHPGRAHRLRRPLVRVRHEDAARRRAHQGRRRASRRARPSRTATRSRRSRRTQVRQIAEQKMKDLTANDIDAAMKIIEGTARSMGVKVE